MGKLTLKADPTFTANVPFPIAGGPSVDVVVTFKHRTRGAVKEFEAWREGKTDAEVVMAMVVGWDIEDEFNGANVETLLDNRMAVGLAMYRVYVDELMGARVKN